MAVSLKEISNGKEFHIRFKKTKILKSRYGEEEELLDEFDFSPEDEYPSEIIWAPSQGRGIETWFNFNKVERFQKHGIFDYHLNLELSPWKYSVIPEITHEMAEAKVSGSMIFITIYHQYQKSIEKYYAHLAIAFEDHSIVIEYWEPFFNTFKDSTDGVEI